MTYDKPTKEEVRAAAGGTMSDIIAPGIDVLFCGINPSLYSAAVGHHFAYPGNRFWKALDAAGFTERVLSPAEDRRLLDYGCGLTNVVERATARASELAPEEFVEGGRRLVDKVRRHRPRFLAVVGIGAYHTAFDRSDAGVGPRTERIGDARVWVLPNPSGLNAHYPLDALGELFGELRDAVAATAATR